MAYPNLGSTFDLPKYISGLESLGVPSTTFSTGLNAELVQVWTVLSEFCAVINRAAAAKQYITTAVLLDTMAPVMYNLVDARFEAGSPDEAMRLGLLAFCCSIFMHWRTMDRSFAHFTREFRACLRSRASSARQVLPPQLSLWLLVIGALSVFGVAGDDDDEWLKPLLREALRECEIGSWGEARELMRSLLWIGLVHDTSGRRVFSSVGVP